MMPASLAAGFLLAEVQLGAIGLRAAGRDASGYLSLTDVSMAGLPALWPTLCTKLFTGSALEIVSNLSHLATVAVHSRLLLDRSGLG